MELLSGIEDLEFDGARRVDDIIAMASLDYVHVHDSCNGQYLN